MFNSRRRYAEASLQADILGNTNTFTQALLLQYNAYTNDAIPWHIEWGINNGIRAANTDFREHTTPDIYYDYGLVARVEYKVCRTLARLLPLHRQRHGAGPADRGQRRGQFGGRARDELSHTLDLQYVNARTGLMFYASYFGVTRGTTRGFPTAPTTQKARRWRRPPGLPTPTSRPSTFTWLIC